MKINNPRVTPDIVEELRKRIELGNTEHQLRKWFREVTQLKKSQANNVFNFTRDQILSNNIPNSFKPNNSISEPGNSLDEVLEKCQVDLKNWNVDDFNVKELSGGKFLWNVYFKKSKNCQEINDLLKNIIPAPFVGKNKYEEKENGVLAELNLADFHIGKLCWAEETGHNYDIKTAIGIFRDAINYKIAQLKKYPVEKILFPVGNDFFQVDNLQNTTTAGTQQDVDSRYGKMFREGTKLIIESIERLREIAPVDVLITPGNHDKLSIFFLGEILEIYYQNNENVNVDTSLLPRKYYKYGKNLLGFTHGNDIKLADLPMIMAVESPKWWGETKYRFVKCGHFHHQKMILNEVSGIIVEIMPSLSGTDSWHKNKGYTGNIRSAVTAIYDKEMGLVGKIYFNL